jgi:hypothetical protein
MISCQEFAKSITVENFATCIGSRNSEMDKKNELITLELLCMNLNLAASDLCRTYEQNIAHKMN